MPLPIVDFVLASTLCVGDVVIDPSTVTRDDVLVDDVAPGHGWFGFRRATGDRVGHHYADDDRVAVVQRAARR